MLDYITQINLKFKIIFISVGAYGLTWLRRRVHIAKIESSNLSGPIFLFFQLII